MSDLEGVPDELLPDRRIPEPETPEAAEALSGIVFWIGILWMLGGAHLGFGTPSGRVIGAVGATVSLTGWFLGALWGDGGE